MRNQQTRPPMTASARSLRIGCASLSLPRGRLLRLAPRRAGAARYAGRRRRGRPSARAPSARPRCGPPRVTTKTLPPSSSTSTRATSPPGRDVGGGREQLRGDPGQLLAALGSSRSSRARTPSRRGSPLDDLRRERQQLGKCLVRLHRAKLAVAAGRGSARGEQLRVPGRSPAPPPPARGANCSPSSRPRARPPCAPRPRGTKIGS